MQITLRAARINAGLSQEQVKEKTGYARSTLVSWESGKVIPRADDLKVLCGLYQIPIECIKIK